MQSAEKYSAIPLRLFKEMLKYSLTLYSDISAYKNIYIKNVLFILSKTKTYYSLKFDSKEVYVNIWFQQKTA